MTDTEQSSQWAVELWTEARRRHDISKRSPGFHAHYPEEIAALTIQRAFAEREAELVGKMRSIMAHFDCDHGNAPGHGHLNAGIWDKDASNGVMGGTECGWCAEWNDMRAALRSREAGHG